MPRKPHICPCCGKSTNKILDYRKQYLPRTVKHEYLHAFREYAPRAYREFQNRLFEFDKSTNKEAFYKAYEKVAKEYHTHPMDILRTGDLHFSTHSKSAGIFDKADVMEYN